MKSKYKSEQTDQEAFLLAFMAREFVSVKIDWNILADEILSLTCTKKGADNMMSALTSGGRLENPALRHVIIISSCAIEARKVAEALIKRSAAA